MEIDVVYRVPKDLCWQYINRFVRPETINLALVRACPDRHTMTKTIRNAVGRLLPSGIFCIHVAPEFVSDVIRVVKDQDLRYKVVYFKLGGSTDEMPWQYVVAWKNDVFQPKISDFNEVKGVEELGSKFINMTDFGDLVLLLGDDVLPWLSLTKRLGRSLIAFGDSDMWIELARNEGVKEEQI